jgi:signal transduction histidine kinase
MPQQPPASTRLERGLARGVVAWRGRYTAWVRRHPLLVDAALVALLLLLSRPGLVIGNLSASYRLLSVALAAALLLPLVWRRRAPFLVFLVIAAAGLIQWLTARVLPADLAVLVAFYTVAAYEPLRRVLIAAGLLEVGAVLAALRFAPAGDRIWGWVLISGLVAAAGFIGYNIRTRRAYLAALEDRAARLERDRDREAQIAASAERARIAREMHDIVAHNLAVMIALADGAAYTTRENPGQAITIMGQVSATGRSALTEMRRLLGVMRQPDVALDHAPQPTLADIDDLLATVRAAGLPTRLTVSGRLQALPPTAQLALYRMIQESLTNTLKHADATAAHVRVSGRPSEVELEVTDDGQAATPTAAAAGHGIAGMRERAAVFGGAVSAGPRPGGGWQVRAVLHVDAVPGGPEPLVGTGPAAGTGPPAETGLAGIERAAGTEQATGTERA